DLRRHVGDGVAQGHEHRAATRDQLGDLPFNPDRPQPSDPPTHHLQYGPDRNRLLGRGLLPHARQPIDIPWGAWRYSVAVILARRFSYILMMLGRLLVAFS